MQTFAWLQDLFRHMRWADAAVWRAVFEAPPEAREDARLLELAHHIALVQDAFLKIWTEAEMIHPELSEFEGPAAVLDWQGEYYRKLRTFLETVTPGDLGQGTELPWAERLAERFGKVPEPTTLAEMMTQVNFHSAYHRGQLLARLRELGGEPPLVDYIAWVWFGRPAAEWPAT
jgi:uncharacterized damage-inducible protein DinB